MKKELQDLKKYLEELKTVSKHLVPTRELYRDRIITIDGVEYIDVNVMGKKNFVTVERYLCSLNNGKTITREQIKKNGQDGSAVIILPVTTNNEIIVTVEPRVFTERTVGIGFPAGYIEEGEKPHVAALRELQEEVGCVPKYLVELKRYYQDEGISGAKNVAFLAVGCQEGYEKHPDPGEFIRYFKCSYDDVLYLEQEGYLESANTLIALSKAQPYFDELGHVKQLTKSKNVIEIK